MIRRFLSIIAVSLILGAAAVAQTPSRLAYQGRLLRSDGTPEAGVLKVGFAVFETPTGGSALWTEEQDLALVDGFYAAYLGELVSLPPGLFESADRYLEVSVAGQALSPRHRLASVPFALNASTAHSLKGGAVEATSLTIAGHPVLDSEGRLAADADWSRLLNVPSGFADGTDDGGLTEVSASAPMTGKGTPEAPLALPAASATSGGYLSSQDWSAFQSKLGAVTAAAPLAGAGTAASPLVLAKASASSDGYLASGDWSAFQAKLGAVVASAPLSGTGTQGAPLVVAKASASTDGYLSSGDWSRFDGKVGEVKAGTGIAVSGSLQVPVVALGKDLTLQGATVVGGTLKTMGSLDFNSQTTKGFRVELASAAPVTCDSGHAGYLYFNTTSGSLSVCNGARFLPLAISHPVSCAAIKSDDPAAGDGNYTIDPDGAGPIGPQTVTCDMTSDGGGWTLVFAHDISGGYFGSASEALLTNEANPAAKKYSILKHLPAFKREGKFTFKINWPGYAKRNVWSQTTNPTDDVNVGGYAAIAAQATSNYWGGLELGNGGHGPVNGNSALIDGSVNHSNWYFAIGSFTPWGTPAGIPAADDLVPSNTGVPRVQLWVK